MQERQIDLSAQVARVRRKTRPWKSIIALVLAIACAVISRAAGHDSEFLWTTSHRVNQAIAISAAVLLSLIHI